MRTGAAVIMGYLFATALSIVLVKLLPMTSGNAFIAGTLFSFIFWLAAIMWSFHATTVLKAWLGLLIPTLILAAIAFALGVGA